MQPLTIAWILIACSAVLFALELFVPSGGIISAIGGLCLIAAVIASFFAGVKTGMIFSIGTTTAVALGLVFFLKVWPHTPVGRRIVMAPQTEGEVIDAEQRESINQLVGSIGLAKTQMLPSGLVIINDETYDAVSEGMAIEPGNPIEVIAVRMNRLIVTLHEHESQRDVAQNDASASDDILNKPIDSFGIDPIDDPLA